MNRIEILQKLLIQEANLGHPVGLLFVAIMRAHDCDEEFILSVMEAR